MVIGRHNYLQFSIEGDFATFVGKKGANEAITRTVLRWTD